MNRDQYLHMRRTGQYDMQWFYQYFLNSKEKKTHLPFEMFYQMFQMYYQMNGRDILEHLDKAFSTTKIEDTNGNITYIN